MEKLESKISNNWNHIYSLPELLRLEEMKQGSMSEKLSYFYRNLVSLFVSNSSLDYLTIKEKKCAASKKEHEERQSAYDKEREERQLANDKEREEREEREKNFEAIQLASKKEREKYNAKFEEDMEKLCAQRDKIVGLLRSA